jgi:hypothetical protein
MDYVLLIGRPVRRERQDRVIFDLDPVVRDINRAYWNGQEGSDLSVFICVREPVDVPERIVSGIDTLLLQLIWLPRFDKSNPVGDIPQKTLWVGRSERPDILDVRSLLPIDRELMLGGQLCSACDHESRDDVVECAPEIVDEIPKEQAESIVTAI